MCFLFSFLVEVVKIKQISRMAEAKDCSYVVWAPQSVFVDSRQLSKHPGCSDTKSSTAVKTQHFPFNSMSPQCFCCGGFRCSWYPNKTQTSGVTEVETSLTFWPPQPLERSIKCNLTGVHRLTTFSWLFFLLFQLFS